MEQLHSQHSLRCAGWDKGVLGGKRGTQCQALSPRLSTVPLLDFCLTLEGVIKIEQEMPVMGNIKH